MSEIEPIFYMIMPGDTDHKQRKYDESLVMDEARKCAAGSPGMPIYVLRVVRVFRANSPEVREVTHISTKKTP